MKIGLIGLGLIGEAWSRRYAAAGVLGGTWNRSPKPSSPAWKDSPAAVGQACDVLQVVVADPPAVEAVIRALLPSLGPGKIVVQSSTIDPASSTRFRALVQSAGARYVECPFTGSKPAAEEGKTVFFLGGDTDDIAAVEPLLAHVSETRFVIGTGEQACSIKLAMNLNLAAMMEVYAESLAFARRAGIPDDIYFSVIARNASYSALAKMKEQKLRQGDWSPQFSVKHMHKDMRLACATAGADLKDYPSMAMVRGRLAEAEARGMADDDYSSLARLVGKA